jgi:integrase
MAALRKRGKIWYVDCYFEGRRRLISTKTSNYQLAKEIRLRVETDISKGIFLPEKTHKSNITLQEFFDEYFKIASVEKNIKTIKNERHYAKKLIATVGNIFLKNLSVKMLDHWKATIIGETSPTTFNIQYRFLHAALNRAIRWGYLENNPVAKITKMKIDEHRLYLTVEETRRVFNKIDQHLLQLRSRKRPTKVALFRKCAVFLLNTGLRIGEVPRLQMKDIDFSNRVIHVEKTKTHLSRTVPLTPEALAILHSLDDSLFQNLREDYVSKHFAYFLKKADLIGFKQHSLRHTFATRLVECGVDLFVISKILGHTSMKTTMIYAKAGVNTLRSAIGQLELGLASIQIGDTKDGKEENTDIRQGDLETGK